MILWKIILVCLDVSDSRASIFDSEVTSSIGNSSASATIMIAMYTLPSE